MPAAGTGVSSAVSRQSAQTDTVGGAAWLAHAGAPLALVVAPVVAGSLLFGVINTLGFVWNTNRLVTTQLITESQQT
jgi:hypothetical protein